LPDLYQATQQHKALAQAVRETLGDDETAIADTIEGLTILDDAIAATIREARAAAAMRNGLLELMTRMKERAERLDYRAQRLMAAALQAAQECGIKKITAPDFTAGIGQSKGKVVIVDEALLPDYCFRTKREIDRAYVRDELLTGVDVPGASLSNPEPHWTVRSV
jgi:phosphoribosylaminoimidazole-succinocarboxamide synthase